MRSYKILSDREKTLAIHEFDATLFAVPARPLALARQHLADG